MGVVTIQDYDGLDGLQELLTDLTEDVDRLITYLDGLYDKWSVVDVRRYSGFHEALVSEDAHPRFYSSVPINTDFPVVFMALTEELIDIDVLCRAVARDHMGDIEKLRFMLSTGVRTYSSKQLGFRWGDRAKSRPEVMEDCKRIAQFIRDARPGQRVSRLRATYEQITLYMDSGRPFTLPLDLFPFVGATRLYGEPDTEMVQKINYHIADAVSH